MNALLSIFSPLKETVNSRNGRALDRLAGIATPHKRAGRMPRKSVSFDMTPKAHLKHSPPHLGRTPLVRKRREPPTQLDADEEPEDDNHTDSGPEPEPTGVDKSITEIAGPSEPEVEPSEPTEPVDEATHPAAADNLVDATDSEFGFTAFVDHKWDGDAMKIQVEWDGGQRTWEPEAMLHDDAPAALLEYWRRQPGGRPDNPRQPGLYEIHAIRKHSRDRKRLFVEWVGYGPAENTWEPRAVVADAAPEILSSYFDSLPRPKRRRVR
ncbi:Chromo domain protein [Cordyceps fumosorosea ARSEF 2679]|uniref:Chromo domain protein n=1 Tax=Cordyceps fumosorosea (strain ARSEF 2679) TaxID=1081104 RepID=A0A167S997_CORFA|nr:Chromo domain protein [Cordyceps fumosorosea ARSEF 2679]OAA59388.1 Chromo domain protein [Cordyceps fumosorosea ARSEF 2679]